MNKNVQQIENAPKKMYVFFFSLSISCHPTIDENYSPCCKCKIYDDFCVDEVGMNVGIELSTEKD